jgi:hypothetical protein
VMMMMLLLIVIRRSKSQTTLQEKQTPEIHKQGIEKKAHSLMYMHMHAHIQGIRRLNSQGIGFYRASMRLFLLNRILSLPFGDLFPCMFCSCKEFKILPLVSK